VRPAERVYADTLPLRLTVVPPTRSSLVQVLVTRDPGLAVSLGLAIVLSIASFVYYYRLDMILGYGDTEARLLITDAVLSGRHPGLGQLGAVWLPFPQVYMLPFTWNDFLLHSGIGGALPSMVCYVVACGAIYKLVSLLTKVQTAGVIAVVAFSNPNVLYLQSTPMSELPFIAAFASAVYFVVKWMATGRLQPLFLAGVAATIATLTRYEGWALLLLLTAVVIYSCWRGGLDYAAAEGYLVFFGLIAFLGVGLWLVWNRVIFGDMLYFLNSAYGTKTVNATQLLGVPAQYRGAGNLRLSAELVGWTVLINAGWVTATVAVLGLVRLLIARRLQSVLALALLLVPIPFSILMVYTGGEVIVDPPLTPGVPPANLRYGLLVLPAAALLVGVIAAARWLRWPVLAACVASSALIWVSGQVNLAEAASIRNSQNYHLTTTAGEWLGDHYDGGLVLAGKPSHEDLLFHSRIDHRSVVYPGDRDEWRSDLTDPAPEVTWIVMTDGQPPDDVWVALHGTDQLRDHYRLVYTNRLVQIYHVVTT
jgi:hypothetical protein